MSSKTVRLPQRKKTLRLAEMRQVLPIAGNELAAFEQEKCIVFLDPDTGLEPQNPGLEHVLNSEAKEIWNAMKGGDVFVFYQHQTNRAGQPWIEPKRKQLGNALNVKTDAIRVARAPRIARDVVFFFAERPK